MPDNPNVTTVLGKARAAHEAQQKVRDAATRLAADIKSSPDRPATPATSK